MRYNLSEKKTPKVDGDLCIGCGVCVSLCPTVFALDDDGKSHVVGELEQDCDVDTVIASCPTSAISI